MAALTIFTYMAGSMAKTLAVRHMIMSMSSQSHPLRGPLSITGLNLTGGVVIDVLEFFLIRC
jgi:hypothetical protein